MIKQLGSGASCFVHVDRRKAPPVEEPYAANPEPLPTLDRPGRFTIHEYARLLVVRSRVQDERWSKSSAPPK